MLAIVLTCKLETLVISPRFYFGTHTRPPPLQNNGTHPTLTILKLVEEEEEQLVLLVLEGVLEPYEHKCAVRTTHELLQVPTL
jgi:hypothetical protein